MKRLVAILLMGILFFNWYGYQLVSNWLEAKADQQLEARLDSDNYDPSQLITIKVAATHLSYYNPSAQFERADGEINVAGVQYKYVERRLYNDSLELRCIPNHTAMNLQSAKNEFFKLVNDLQTHGSQGKKADTHGVAKAFSDYNMVETNGLTGGIYAMLLPQPIANAYVLSLSSAHHLTVEQPPDTLFA